MSFLWNCWLTLPQSLRVFVYRLLYERFSKRTSGGFTRLLPFGIVAKYAETAEEACATQYIQAHTTIPVPTMLDVVPFTMVYSPTVREVGVLQIMTRLEGKSMGEQFDLRVATEEQKTVIHDVLSDWLHQLRDIPPPHPQRVCGFWGGSLYSPRIDSKRVGPYDNPAELHSQNFCIACPDYPDEASDKVKHLIELRPQKKYRIHFTHGDIVPHNILVDVTGRPTGLIDFESASWMPEYWEFTRAMYPRIRFKNWVDIWRPIFPQYQDDLEVEIRTWLWYNPN